MKIARLTALGIALSVFSSPLVAQTSGCVPSDSMAVALRGFARDIVGTTDDPEYVPLRSSVGLVVTDSSTVAITTDATICTKVVNAINAARGTPNQIRHVHVVKLGTGKNVPFMAMEPESTARPRGVWVFDRRFAFLGVLATF